jgi:Flp pilus assembly protein TadG
VSRAPSPAERGAVTAELAMAVPLLLAVTLGLVWLLTLGTAQVRMVDATRETARAVARGEDAGPALDRGRQVAPPGASLAVTDMGDRVVVSGTVQVDGVGGLLEVLPSVELTAEAVSAREDVPP